MVLATCECGYTKVLEVNWPVRHELTTAPSGHCISKWVCGGDASGTERRYYDCPSEAVAAWRELTGQEVEL